MIGTRIQGGGGFAIFAFLFSAVAVACFVGAVAAANPHWAVFAALPGGLAVALWLTRRPSFAADVTADGLRLFPSGQLIAFTEMQRVGPADGTSAGQTGPSFPLELIHSQGRLQIPEGLNVSSRALAEFLAARMPAQPTTVNPRLEQFWEQHLAACPAEQVWVFNARDFAKKRRRRRLLACAIAGLIVSVVWVVLGALHIDDARRWGAGSEWAAWMGAGMLGGLIWLLVLLFARTERQPPQRGILNPEASSLIVSSLGLAIAQGRLCGELRWNEVVEVVLRRRDAWIELFSQTRVRSGIYLLVMGRAELWIADIYDQPLEAIYARIRQYWGH